MASDGPAGEGGRAGSSTALVAVQPQPLPNLWDDQRLQRLWLAVDRRPWRSLAIMGGGATMQTTAVAELIAQLAWRYRGQPSSVTDLRDLGMRLIDYELREMREQIETGTRLLVALRSIFENPTAAPVAKHMDAVLICIVLGETPMKAVEETIAAVGRERVLGSIVLRPAASKNKPRTNGRR